MLLQKLVKGRMSRPLEGENRLLHGAVWLGISRTAYYTSTFSQDKKKPGNPHLRGPSGFSKPPKMVGRVGFE
ncbi:hypothetical protein, partial [Pseudomonas veronii]|uniref:hypothetical protein n=1 Tax=Pseudomonas veronii TaxID=76761 RepID=UPI001CC1C968